MHAVSIAPAGTTEPGSELLPSAAAAPLLVRLQRTQGNRFVQRLVAEGRSVRLDRETTGNGAGVQVARQEGAAEEIPAGTATHLRRAYLEDLFLLYAASKDSGFRGGPGVHRTGEGHYVVERSSARSRFEQAWLAEHAGDIEEQIERKLETKMASASQRMLERRAAGESVDAQSVGGEIMAWYRRFIDDHVSGAGGEAAAWLRAQIDRRFLPAPGEGEEGNQSRLGAEIAAQALARSRTASGLAYDYPSGGGEYSAAAGANTWFYSPNSGLRGWRDHHRRGEKNADGSQPGPIPSGEGVVNWGAFPTCNLFVYDVIYLAGGEPPLNSVRHYYSASGTYSLRGGLSGFLTEVDGEDALPGDINCSTVHMEIVLTRPQGGSFQALGAHSDGTYSRSRQVGGWKFFRVV